MTHLNFAMTTLLNGVWQERPGSVAGLPIGERDPEGNHQVGQVITVLVTDLLRVDEDLEAVGLGPSRGQEVHVGPGAPAHRDEQQLDRGEGGVGIVPAAHADLAAAGVDRRVPAGLDAFEPNAAVRKIGRAHV